MKRENATSFHYTEVSILGQPALFADWRIKRDSVPEGLHLYELRHADEDWGDPCELAPGVMVNFFGSILTSEPIQLPPHGHLDFETADFSYVSEGAVCTIQEFLKRHPAVGKDIMELHVPQSGEQSLFYSQDKSEDYRNGCVGHLRGDFGSGREFWTTWWPHQHDRLNGGAFKADLARVVNWLRQDFSPLKDLDSMSRFCALHDADAKLPGAFTPAHGFRIDTQQFQYTLRCSTVKGDYNFYLYCYDKAEKARVRDCTTPKEDTRRPAKKHEPER